MHQEPIGDTGMPKRRITDEQRQELIDALRQGDVTNASAFAQTYAQKNDLNPNTVRSTLSRLRREVGSPKKFGAASSELLAEILGADDPAELVDIAAAVLLRYDHDAEFQQAVDARREAFRKVYSGLFDALRTADQADVNDELVWLMLQSKWNYKG